MPTNEYLFFICNMQGVGPAEMDPITVSCFELLRPQFLKGKRKLIENIPQNNKMETLGTLIFHIFDH